MICTRGRIQHNYVLIAPNLQECADCGDHAPVRASRLTGPQRPLTDRLQAIVDACQQFTETTGYREGSNSEWIGPFLAQLEDIAAEGLPTVERKLFTPEVTR